jgi:ketosteroid isomerase-like protein
VSSAQTSQSNLATVQGIYEAFGRGDIPAILDQVADDVVWDRFPGGNAGAAAGVPWLEERTSREGVGEFFQTLAGIEFHVFAPVLDTAKHVEAIQPSA